MVTVFSKPLLINTATLARSGYQGSGFMGELLSTILKSERVQSGLFAVAKHQASPPNRLVRRDTRRAINDQREPPMTLTTERPADEKRENVSDETDVRQEIRQFLGLVKLLNEELALLNASKAELEAEIVEARKKLASLMWQVKVGDVVTVWVKENRGWEDGRIESIEPASDPRMKPRLNVRVRTRFGEWGKAVYPDKGWERKTEKECDE